MDAMALTASSGLTEAQSDLIAALDDVSEHVAWEFDESEYRGISTCGFAHIHFSGNSSLYRRLQSLAGSDHPDVEFDQRNDIVAQVGGLELTVMESHDSGYRLSIRNVKDYISGPEYQRLDVRKRLHSLVLERLRYNGYADSARIYTRMD
jgi:hypothetical protein